MKETKRWECDYCEQEFYKKSACEKHEKSCKKNPSWHTCETCKKSTLVMGIYGYERFCEEIQTTLRDISTKCPLWEGKNV